MEVLRLLTFLCVSVWSLDMVSSNQPPFVSFGPLSSNVFFAEDTAIGTSLFSIIARDSDSSAVTFTIQNDETKALVQLTPVVHNGDIWSVNVLLKAVLDRDRSPNTRSLLFRVSDGQSDIDGQVRLIVTDVNDNPPQFVNLPYRITLEEGTSLINKTVLVAYTSDPDDGPGGSVIYSMKPQLQGADENYRKTFIIPNEKMGNITLAAELDFETRSYYQYQIFATDRGQPPCPGAQCRCSNVTEPSVTCAGDPATFIVIVKDVQDSPPFFEHLPYIAEVPENASVGTSFFQVSAQDGDRGVPNAVSYSIVNAASSPFTMENTTGILRVGPKGLDADQPNGRNYILTVMASEVIKPGEQPGGETNATTRLAITVNDINDNAPRFAKDVYYAKVLENTPRGVPLTLTDTIEVRDKDQNENSQFKLSVEKNGTPYTAFTTLPGPSTVVQSMTTVMISVLNSSVLDYEVTKNITFQLKATEASTTEGKFNTTTVIVTIEDMNDNSPVFLPEQTTAVNVTEHAAPGVVLATFTATDADEGDYGNVSYSLEDDLGKFAMDPQSGNLSVKADVDREAPGGAGYSLVVVATDNMAGDEAQRRSRRLNIRVTVLDINDNAPVFQVHPPTVTVQENASPGTALITLTATDKDEGVNGDIVYKVVSIQSPAYVTAQPRQSLFKIGEKTGVISVNASLIGYPGAHNVTVMASDSAEAPKNVSTTVTVHVQDVNTNEPIFVVPDEKLVKPEENSLPNITIDEEQPVGTLILQLNATDADTGSNGVVYYFLEPDVRGHSAYFSVNTTTGRLTNKQKLDLEKTPMFQITLKAEDQGTPPHLSKKVDFRIFLRDVNDNDPVFPPPATLTLKVGEEVKNQAIGLVNVSVDADPLPQHKIACYYIYGGDMVDAFYLTKTTGELRILKKLDRDKTPKVNLTIKASPDCGLREDHFTATNGGSNAYNASDPSLLRLVVEVIDINDNPPVFKKDALTVGMLYDVSIGYEVINLVPYTTDEDTPANSRNYYELVATQPKVAENASKPFKVSRNGSVVTNRLFRADEDGSFVLTVKAFDSAGQTDVANVTIYLVSDAQRVKLVSNRQPNEVLNFKVALENAIGTTLNMKIIVDKIATHIATDGTADPKRTDIFIHARYPSGKIVPVSELWNAFDYNPAMRRIFQDYGITEATRVLVEKRYESDREWEKAFIIVTVVLIIICIVLVIVLINTIRRYRRRLRAATTSAFVSRQDDSLSNSHVPPGTNKYYAAENPLFGKDVKPMYVDRLDNDSLDDNAVDSNAPGSSSLDNDNPDGKDKIEEQEMYLELYDDDDNHPGMHINHLAMVLQEYSEGGGKETEGEEEDGDHSSSSHHAPPPYRAGGKEEGEGRSKPAVNGHVKSDSGFNESGGGGDGAGEDEEDEERGRLANLQYSDI